MGKPSSFHSHQQVIMTWKTLKKQNTDRTQDFSLETRVHVLHKPVLTSWKCFCMSCTPLQPNPENLCPRHLQLIKDYLPWCVTCANVIHDVTLHISQLLVDSAWTKSDRSSKARLAEGNVHGPRSAPLPKFLLSEWKECSSFWTLVKFIDVGNSKWLLFWRHFSRLLDH